MVAQDKKEIPYEKIFMFDHYFGDGADLVFGAFCLR